MESVLKDLANLSFFRVSKVTHSVTPAESPGPRLDSHISENDL